MTSKLSKTTVSNLIDRQLSMYGDDDIKLNKEKINKKIIDHHIIPNLKSDMPIHDYTLNHCIRNVKIDHAKEMIDHLANHDKTSLMKTVVFGRFQHLHPDLVTHFIDHHLHKLDKPTKIYLYNKADEAGKNKILDHFDKKDINGYDASDLIAGGRSKEIISKVMDKFLKLK